MLAKQCIEAFLWGAIAAEELLYSLGLDDYFGVFGFKLYQETYPFWTKYKTCPILGYREEIVSFFDNRIHAKSRQIYLFDV